MARIVTMTCLLLALPAVSGCRSAQTRPGEGSRLDLLESGMEMEEAVKLLGPPGTRTTVRPDPLSPACHELIYPGTVLAGETVTLRFEPGLRQIRVGEEIWRDFAPGEDRP